MQLPSGAGVWPAFWLDGVNGISKTRTTNSAEIDILEAFGVDMTKAHEKRTFGPRTTRRCLQLAVSQRKLE
jgi:Glycosyl hydrolases family 16